MQQPKRLWHVRSLPVEAEVAESMPTTLRPKTGGHSPGRTTSLLTPRQLNPGDVQGQERVFKEFTVF